MDNLNIFLLFPQTDDEILAFDEDNRYIEIPEQLKKVKDVLNLNYTLFHDSENIVSFCNEVEKLHDGKYLGSVRNQIRHYLNRISNDIKTFSCEPDCCYYKWKIDSNPLVEMESNKIFLSAVEKFVDDKPGNAVIISLLNNDTWERDIMPIIKDAKHYKDLPILCNIPYFSTVNTFIEWYNTKKGNRDFSLLDKSRFERTSIFYSKERIYKEKETHRYWYYDYFHKDNKEHYEVFDREGNHLGEADVNGNLDESKCDKTKSIKNLLN